MKRRKRLRLKKSVKKIISFICLFSVAGLLFSIRPIEAKENNIDTNITLKNKRIKLTPTIKTTSNKFIVNQGDNLSEVSLLSKITSEIGVELPYLDIKSNVDTSKEGFYNITYTAINKLGKKIDKTVSVEVRIHDEVIEKEFLEFSQLVNSYNLDELTRFDTNIKEELLTKYNNLSDRAKEHETDELEIIDKIEETVSLREQEYQAELKKKQEEERKRQEEQARLLNRQTTTASVINAQSSNVPPQANGGTNPYYGGWGNCTWGAWQLVHDNLGISLPGWGNAGDWLWRAQNSGWNTGSTPRPGAIVVSTHHVAYVTDVSADGSSIFVKEGNYNGWYHEGWTIAQGCNGQCVLGYIYP